MPTLEQIRAARALLGWNQTELAEASGLSQTGIARIENGTNQPNSHTLKKIEAAFDKAGIEFIAARGVQVKENSFQIFQGKDGFSEFVDDVYVNIKENGGEFCVFNADPNNWSKWLSEEKWNEHKSRMVSIKETITGKIILHQSNDYLLGNDYAEYRWSTSNEYDSQKTLYSYSDRLAFMDFRDDSLVITIMKRMEFAAGFRVLFNAAWEQAEKIN